MFNSRATKDLSLCSGALLKLYRVLGFAHFGYNPGSGFIEVSNILFLVSRIVLRILQLQSGFWLVAFTTPTIINFVLHDIHMTDLPSIAGVLWALRVIRDDLQTFLLVTVYLQEGHLIVPALNEMLKVYQTVGRFCSQLFCFPAEIQLLCVVKVCLSALRICCELRARCLYLVCGDVSNLMGLFLSELTFWSHLQANLAILYCVLAMSAFLRTTRSRKTPRYINQVIAIMFRLIRLKRTVNRFFSAFILCVILGLFNDIGHIYLLFRVVLGLDEESAVFHWSLSFSALQSIPVAISSSLDVLLISYVSDVLTDAEQALRRQVFLHGNDMSVGSLDVRLFEISGCVDDLSTKMLNSFAINRKLFFAYMVEAIIAYAIVCLQLSIANEFSYSVD